MINKREKVEKRVKNEILGLLKAKRFPEKRFKNYELVYGFVYTYRMGDDPEQDFATKEEISCEGFSNEEIENFYQLLIDAIYLELYKSLNDIQIGYLLLALDRLEAFKKNRKGELQLLKEVSPRAQYIFVIYVHLRFYYERKGCENPSQYGKFLINLLKEGEK